MAHEITASDAFGEVRARGERAWHGLGVEIPENNTTWDSFQQIGLGWETQMEPVFAKVGDRDIELPDHRAHIRSDNHALLGVVSGNYQPISNRQLAEFADALVGADKNVETETAGSLRGGRHVFALVRLPGDIEVTNVDILQQYVLIRNGHDGTASFQVYPTSVRVVCANTLRMSERDQAKGLRFQHTGDIAQKIDHARLALGLISDANEKFAAQVRVLSAKHLAKDEVAEYFKATYDRIFGVIPEGEGESIALQMEMRDEILKKWDTNFNEDPRQQLPGIRGTAWAAYNAISQWEDHERGRYKPLGESDGRVYSNLFGVSHRQKAEAFDSALALV